MVRRQESERVTLKTVARQVGLAPGTISAVLNNSGQAHGIPQQTKDRIFAAAHELNDLGIGRSEIPALFGEPSSWRASRH